MTHIEKAIREAVEKGGYIASTKKVGYHLEVDENATFLDPAFWQALGKARGWGKHYWVGQSCPNCQHCSVYKDGTYSPMGYYAGKKPTVPKSCKGCDWKNYWHRLIDHLAEGKTAEEYFAAALNPIKE